MGISRLPDGRRIRWLGQNKHHECFTHEIFGTVDVRQMQRDVDRGARHIQYMTVKIDAGSIQSLEKRDFDPMVLMRMTPERAVQPVLMFALDDGTHTMVDGNHRLKWLIEHGAETFRCCEFPGSSIPRYRVRVEISDGHGWRPISNIELLEKTWGRYAGHRGERA